MAGNLIYITDAGRAALVAPGNTGTTAHQVTQIGLATAAFVFKPDMIAMPSELKRITTFGGDTVAKDTIHIVIQDDSADQYKLYGFGLYLDNGVLFGVYVQNDPILEKAAASMLLLAADTVFASIDVTKLVFGPTSFLNPPATTERKGVVELATQAEVDDGADDTRAVTPKTAAARYAPLVRPQLTGPVSVTSTPTDQDAQLSVAAASGALNRGAKIRLHGTFAAGTADTNARLIASIRAGYDGGTWGREYLDFWINRAPNDSNSDANQVRAVRITYGGRVVIGNRNDDTANAFQVGGNGAFSGGVASGGLDAGGANFRLMNGKDVLLRNDGSNFYVLLSNGSGYGASWNDFRPITVNVATGVLSLDDTGAGTYVGGQLNVKGMLNVSNGNNEGRALIGSSGGYLFGNATEAGFYLPSNGAMFALNFTRKNLHVNGKDVWHAGNLPNPAQTTGITMSGQFLAAEGTVNNPGISFVNDGAPDTGLYHIADGVFAVTNNGRETMRFLAGSPSNRVLFGTPDDDGSNLAQFGGSVRALNYFINNQTAGDSGLVGIYKGVNGPNIGFYGRDTIGAGALTFSAGGTERARVTANGKFVVGKTGDDGSGALIQANGGVKGVSGVGALVASNGSGTTQTSIILRREGGTVDQKQWEVLHGGDGAFTIRTVNDGYSQSRDVFYVTRGGGIAAGNMGLMPNGGRVLIGGAVDTGAILNAAGLVRGLGFAVDGGPSWATIYFQNGNTTRFTLGKSDTDDFALSAFENDGTTQRRVLDIQRLTQQVNFVKRPAWAGATPWDSMNLTPLDKNVGGTMQAALYVQAFGGSKNGFEIGNADAAAYDKHNFAMVGWNGMGMKTYDGSVNGYYDFRTGKWDVKGGFYVNGARVWDQGTFDPNSKLNKAGDTATGDLRVKQPNNTDARGFVLARADGTAQAWIHGTMNGNYSAWATMNPDGSWRSNPIIVYNDDNRVVFNSDIHVTTNSRFYSRPTLNRDGWQADIGLRNNRPGYDSWTYLRARDGGGMEIINSAYNAVTWSVDDWGTMYMRGQQILNTDGNLKLAFRGGVWLSDQLGNIDNALNSKAGAGARVQWDSGVNNFGTVDRLNGALPAPWVVCGLSGPGNGTANAIVVYGVVLRNQ
ncbi:phage tail protein [Burkholderia sp. LMG 32019]|uniref:phage tail protein n=1 Tax=Burkholderia sp. LMG 32019 TaxID=3158173 RepID=UPI003C2C09B9